MAYIEDNPKSKAEVKRWIADPNHPPVRAFQPGYGEVPTNGRVSIEGPHYPKPHTWWGTATIVDGIVTEVS